MNSKLAKKILVSLATTAIGMSATIINEWLNDKKMDAKIEKKIIEVLTKNKEES